MCEVVDKIKAEGRNEGRNEGIKKGRAEGEAIGKVAGRAEGENQIINLYKILKSKNRLADFTRAVQDKIFLNQLKAEFNIQ